MSSESKTVAKYVRLGGTGMRVSVPILGCMSIGSSKWASWVLDEKESIEILQAAWERGVSTIDTANVYSNGESERVIGKWMAQYKIPRHKLLIFSKVHGLVADDPGIRTILHPEMKDQRDYVNQSGLSRGAIFNATDALLARLGTPYVDLLQIHRFDPNTPAEETMRALHDLVQQGKVRYIGASSMRAWQFAHYNDVADKHGWTKFVSMQNEHSLLYREEEREMMGYCAFNGIGVIPWGPLAAGQLTRALGTATERRKASEGTPFAQKESAADEAVIKRVEELAKKKGVSMAQVALAWSKSKVSSPIVGISSPKRLDEALVAVELTDEEKKYLEEPYIPKPTRGHL